MSLANALKKAATKTLSKLGGDITIKKITAGSYIAAFDDIAAVDNITNIDEFTGGVIEEKRLTISAGDLSFAPTTKDRVVISSVEFKIIQVNTNEQNNTPISFDLILR